LRRRNQDGGNPAQDNPDVRDHGQDHDKHPDERGKVQSKTKKGGPNKQAVDKANKKLSPEVRDNIAVDLQKNGGDFIF